MSAFAPPVVRSYGVGTGGLNASEAQQGFAQGAAMAPEVMQNIQRSTLATKVTPRDEFKALERMDKHERRLEKREDAANKKWLSTMNTKGPYSKKAPVYKGLGGSASPKAPEWKPLSERSKTSSDSYPPLQALLSRAPEAESSRLLKILPFLGAVAGGTLALKNPRLAKQLGMGDVRSSKIMAGALGSGAGATIGWLPEVTYNAGNAVFGKVGSSEPDLDATLLASISRVTRDAEKLGSAAAMAYLKMACVPVGGMQPMKHDDNVHMISKSLDSLAAQAMELKKRVDRGGVRIPAWAERKVYRAADSIKDALSSAFTMHKPTIRITIIKAANEGARLAARPIAEAPE